LKQWLEAAPTGSWLLDRGDGLGLWVDKSGWDLSVAIKVSRTSRWAPGNIFEINSSSRLDAGFARVHGGRAQQHEKNTDY